MNFFNSRQRLYAFLLFLGAGILLYRTLRMIYVGSLDVLMVWVSVLLFAEMLVDAGCMAASVKWWLKNDPKDAKPALRLGAAVALLHAFRVLIFVMGRVGPWVDFDVRPEHRTMHGERWTWGWLYFAAIMAVLGVIGVIVIWQYRKKKLNSE